MVAIKQIITTTGSNVASVFPQDTSYLTPCDHEEADTRMILHLAGTVNKGLCVSFIMHSTNIPAVVLSVAAATK